MSTVNTSSSSVLSLGSDPRTIFLVFIQPWFGIASLILNGLIVIVFMFYVRVGPKSIQESSKSSESGSVGGVRVGKVSRLYFSLLGLFEFSYVVLAVIICRTLYFVPFWVLL